MFGAIRRWFWWSSASSANAGGAVFGVFTVVPRVSGVFTAGRT